MANYVLLFVSIALAIAGQLLMKQGMSIFGTFPVNKIHLNIIPMFLNPWVFAGMVVFAVSSIFWLAVLSRIQLSLAYPMVSIAYVIVALFSMIVFKENVTAMRWAGIAVICFGVFLISRS